MTYDGTKNGTAKRELCGTGCRLWLDETGSLHRLSEFTQNVESIANANARFLVADLSEGRFELTQTLFSEVRENDGRGTVGLVGIGKNPFGFMHRMKTYREHPVVLGLHFGWLKFFSHGSEFTYAISFCNWKGVRA